ncbi:MAG: phosphatidylserine decarboxylase, partial [Akkermansiaceae bacterium]|nr:phosphatidylserine decarboxylase [Akkermansiaceae bacterium]
MSRPASRSKIGPFIETYRLDEGEFLEPRDSYGSFNAFFRRRLRAGARPVLAGAGEVVFPADGRHFAIPELGREEGVFVKGQRFDLAGLLGDHGLAEEFAGGTL